MATDCEQTRAQMLELVYGELAAEARAAIDTHVAGCDACRAELRALESTRSLARRALASDVPPARAHAAILRAAAAVPARAAVQPAAPPRSFWAWMRGKWTLPTFATVGAVAVFLLASRIFLEPEKTFERGRRGVVPAKETSPEPAPALEPAGKLKQADAPAAAKAEQDEEDDKAPPPTRPAVPRSQKKGGASGGGRSERAEPARKPKASLDDLIPAPPEAAPAPPRSATRGTAPRVFAPAPAVPKREVFDNPLEGFSSAAPAPGAPAPAAKRAARAKAAIADMGESEPAAGSAPAPAGAPPLSARETAPARADRLFAQHRWAEAAVVYRDLLRDEPRSPEAARWRQRLTACQAAIDSAR